MAQVAPGCMVDGDPSAPVLLIAMAPGREELQADKPLVGPSGKLLWKQLLKKAGISRPDCYIINTIGEWPEDSSGSPTMAQFCEWWDVFDEAVRQSKARVALVLGGDALWRFCGFHGKRHGIEDWRGYIVGREECWPLSYKIEVLVPYKAKHKLGQMRIVKVSKAAETPWPPSLEWAIPTYHPAGVIRTGLSVLPAFAADCARLGRALRRELNIVEHEWHDGVLRRACGNCAASAVEECYFDIETGGLNNDIITRIGATTGGYVWTALWDHVSRPALIDSLGHGASVAFNIAFDAPRLMMNGVQIPEPWEDVMLMAQMLKPDMKKSLNFVISLYTDSRRHKHLNDDEPAKYNALDVAKTKELRPILKAELERTGQWDLFTKRIMPAVPVLAGMTTRGILVDPPVRDAWITKLATQHTDCLGRWEQLAPGIKTTGKNLNKFLFETVGLKTQYSKKGGVTSEVSGLKKLLLSKQLTEHQCSIINTLIELRSVQKDLKTYAETVVSEDGCVHPGFLPAGKDDDEFGKGIAGTGRMASSRPNIQNQTPEAKRMFIPHKPGWVLMEADFSQIEARIIAQLSGDDVLWEAIHEGLHESNQKALGVDRTRAKNGFFGWAYGAGKRTLHKTFIKYGFLVSEKECGALLQSFDRRFRRASAWRRRVSLEVSTHYHLTNAFGRRRYFMGGSDDVPAGLDYHPQSCAADIMWSVLRPLDDRLRGLDAALLATVHDSILLECRAGLEGTCAAILHDVMEQPWPELGGLVVPIEIETGLNWGELHPYAA